MTQASVAAFLPSRLRATRTAAAAPNSRIIGGAGTWVPPVDEPPPDELPWLDEPRLELPHEEEPWLELPQLEDPWLDEPWLDEPLLELPLDVDEEVLDEVEELVELPVEVDDEVELEDPPVEVEVELPPVEVEVELPPVEVDDPPVEVEVDEPPVELPPVEVEVEPPDEVLEITIPPVELPPKKPPEKKPPPKPKPPPDEPPTTTRPPEPPLDATATGGGGGGANMGGMMVRVTVCVGAAQATRLTVRRTSRRPEERRVVVRVREYEPRRALCEEAADRSTTVCEREGVPSATWTALPPMIAPPHVQAQSFARAILTDITASLFLAVRFRRIGPGPNSSPVRT